MLLVSQSCCIILHSPAHPCNLPHFVSFIVGVHAIFGAFLAGLAIPREGGFAIALTERLEDLAGIIFLPLV